jgi:uncharacterized protein involved in response to NO
MARMVPWWTSGVLTRPLLWVLHLGHASVGLGLCLTAVQPWFGPAGSGPLHALTVGGIGLLTLGMMARVSLGHTGRKLRVGVVMGSAFAAVAVSLLLRVFGPWADMAHTTAWLWGASAGWTVGFGTFVVVYLPILLTPRADGKPG